MPLTEQNRLRATDTSDIQPWITGCPAHEDSESHSIDPEYKKILFWLFSCLADLCLGVYKFHTGSRALGINLAAFSLVPLYLTATDKIHFIYNPWIRVTGFIGEIIQKAVLMLFFFLVILPMSLLMKLFKGDFLHKKPDKKASTFWIDYIYSESRDQSSANYENYNMFSLFFEYWRFLMLRKKYWLLPLILMLILMGIFILFVQGSAISPFIYTVF